MTALGAEPGEERRGRRGTECRSERIGSRQGGARTGVCGRATQGPDWRLRRAPRARRGLNALGAEPGEDWRATEWRSERIGGRQGGARTGVCGRTILTGVEIEKGTTRWYATITVKFCLRSFYCGLFLIHVVDIHPGAY